MSILAMTFGGGMALVIAIIFGAFLSEDAATVTAATLAAGGLLNTKLAFCSTVAGLWFGDIIIYALARVWQEKAKKPRWLTKAMVQLDGHARTVGSDWSLAISRFIPGTRLPAYVASGLNRMPFFRFAGITAASAICWTGIVFSAIWLFPTETKSASMKFPLLTAAALSVFALILLWRLFNAPIRATVKSLWQRIIRWEFWPAWIFYAPIPFLFLWLGFRYRGLALPTVANLNQKNGGMIGESKIEILRELMKTSPAETADAYLVPSGKIEERISKITRLLECHKISMPFVLKPDTAQRGSGFRKVDSLRDIERYLRQVAEPLVLQRYVEGPKEAGVFYYRYPKMEKGEIFGITRKRFPFIVGDGVHSLEELIEADERARFLSAVYIKRLGSGAGRIPEVGEKIKLVEAGNHCQGCIFEDGWDLYSEELRRSLDEISRRIPGFYVGRFDLRYTTDEALRAGTEFQIIELNGASSEATNLYDARNTLRNAYRTLYQQWKMIYEIGYQNRELGAVPRPVISVLRDWRDFSDRACEFPIAD